eukprot:8862511-Pyramimonas_sp.AAC.1
MYTAYVARATTATWVSTGIANTTRSTRGAALRPATAHVRAVQATVRQQFGNSALRPALSA